MIYHIGKFICFLIFKVFFRIKVSGTENIPGEGGFIVAGNHISYLDPVAIGVACPRKLNYMAKYDLFCSPLFSWVLRAVGVFPVKRNGVDFGALREAMRRVKEGKGLLLFPEGTRSVTGKLLPPESGAGFLAAKLDVPVIPAFVNGTAQALPPGEKMFKPTTVSVRFGRQISIERSSPYQDIAVKIMENIRRLSC